MKKLANPTEPLLTKEQRADLDEVVAGYIKLLQALETLPPTRQRQLAITKLEESFSRAVFAVAGVCDPIRWA